VVFDYHCTVATGLWVGNCQLYYYDSGTIHVQGLLVEQLLRIAKWYVCCVAERESEHDLFTACYYWVCEVYGVQLWCIVRWRARS
jgi:hypothetical protein